jgi:hypothetical protein
MLVVENWPLPVKVFASLIVSSINLTMIVLSSD